MGHLTRNPEIRYSSSGTAVGDFGLAINRTYGKEGAQKKETCFVDLTVFGRRAEVIGEYFSKGDPILVEGRLHLDQWESQAGEKRSKLKVIVENLEFVGQKKDRGQDAEKTDPATTSGDETPF